MINVPILRAGLDRMGWAQHVGNRFADDDSAVIAGVVWALAYAARPDGLVLRVHWPALARDVFAISAEESRQPQNLAAVQEALEVLEAEGWIEAVDVSAYELTVATAIEVSA